MIGVKCRPVNSLRRRPRTDRVTTGATLESGEVRHIVELAIVSAPIAPEASYGLFDWLKNARHITECGNTPDTVERLCKVVRGATPKSFVIQDTRL